MRDLTSNDSKYFYLEKLTILARALTAFSCRCIHTGLYLLSDSLVVFSTYLNL